MRLQLESWPLIGDHDNSFDNDNGPVHKYHIVMHWQRYGKCQDYVPFLSPHGAVGIEFGRFALETILEN